MKTVLETLCLVTALGCATGCVATVGHSTSVSVPKDSPKSCAASCEDMGLALSSVVIMANNVGCVCVPRSGPSNPTADSGGAAAAGAVTLMLQDAEAQAQAQQPATH